MTRFAKEYLSNLKDGRTIYINGERGWRCDYASCVPQCRNVDGGIFSTSPMLRAIVS